MWGVKLNMNDLYIDSTPGDPLDWLDTVAFARGHTHTQYIVKAIRNNTGCF